MKFKLCHDPEKKTLTIPRAALQLSKLDEAEHLTIHTDAGCVLVARDDLSATECIGMIQMLSDLNVTLICQLAEASWEVLSEESPDCDSGSCFLTTLLEKAGISMNEPVSIQTEGGQLVIAPAEDCPEEPFHNMDRSFLTMLAQSGVNLSGLHQLLAEENGGDPEDE